MPAEQTDVDIVLRCFDAFMSRDVDSLLALLAADVEVKSLMTEAERIHYHGHDGVQEWIAAVFEIFPDWMPRPAEAHDVGGGAVLVRMDVTATATASGVPIDQNVWEISTVEDGKITWFGFYRTAEDALAAVEERR
jgi:ketosteroid isomerase-like protein